MTHWIQDNDIQQVSISPGWVGREGLPYKKIGWVEREGLPYEGDRVGGDGGSPI